MSIFNIISMLGGLALFLYGMRIMGDGLKKESSGSFKKALEKVTGNPLIGFLIGAGLTAIIQSSTATIVIVSGLVGAGIMTLDQSIGIILGANVGTTITGQIIRLLDVDASGTQWLNFFKPDNLAPVAAIIGIVFIMFVKSNKSGTIGTIAMGFGILFTGLLNMTGAVEPLSESEGFISLFTGFGTKPLLGFLVGLAVSFILQSSSATVGILQALSITGMLTFGIVYPMLIGIYIGDCVTTAIVCSIGAKTDARRTGMVNIIYNGVKIVLIFAAVNILHGMGLLDALWDKPLNSGGIADVHTVFNIACAIVILPFAKKLVVLSRRVIKDSEDVKTRGSEIEALDEALFKSPALALNSCYKALCTMGSTISTNLEKSLTLLDKFSAQDFEDITLDEDYLDDLEDALNAYLSNLSPYLSHGLQEDIQSYYLLCVTDLERAGDHVYSIAECASLMTDKSVVLSDAAGEELEMMHKLLESVLGNTRFAMEKQNLDAARSIQAGVEVVNELAEVCKEKHIGRMKKGICDVVAGSIFLDVLTHMGRIADMCSNIGIHTLARHNPTVENYEHQYMAALRRGDNEQYNEQYKALREEYILPVLMEQQP